jgi:hypothetical protein
MTGERVVSKLSPPSSRASVHQSGNGPRHHVARALLLVGAIAAHGELARTALNGVFHVFGLVASETLKALSFIRFAHASSFESKAAKHRACPTVLL